MSRLSIAVTLVVALVLTAVLWPRPDALVVYCAHDAVYSEAILRRFERESGIAVAIRFDTEATKSLSLVNRLLSERNRPQCDVFWNNEQLGTMSLSDAGILEPYQGPGWKRIPERFKEPHGRWTGFAARFRVWILKREEGRGERERLEKPLDQFPLSPLPSPLNRFAVAIPLYGTTLTHYAAMWDRWGEARLKAWHRSSVKQGMNLVPGNGRSMGLVADGICDLGWTDTDDFFVAKDEGKPVNQRPVRIDGRTIAIPNTVAIVGGTKRGAAARKLVDFLLSAEVELELARSKSRQVPLGPVKDSELPAEVRELKPWVKESLDLRTLLPARNACLTWLQQELSP